MYQFIHLDHDRVVSLLIKNGADVNAVHDEGRTALHLAAKNGSFEWIFIKKMYIII